eukprot:806486-Lingulodinium_polyedra.AAC.1
MSWQVSYLQRAQPPFSFSNIVLGKHVIRKADCLVVCLAKVWEWHQETIGEVRPRTWVFSSKQEKA